MSNLLEQASLVMIPSGYKEDVVYSQIPLDGSGDMTLTRASNGTRVNSAGLVEVCPWNFNTNSENFTSNWGTDGTSTATNNFATAPNGTLTAAKVVANIANGYAYKFLPVPAGVYTLSFYVRASASATMSMGINDIGGSGPSPKYNIPVTTEWQRIEHFANITLGTTVYIDYGTLQTGKDYYIWGAQLNIGSTAKPYFPTTDRLNVPRLTYQNGGGGCPSLLLEKQSTNLVTYSEEFSNAAWVKTTSSITANNVISPDGTQNADTLTANASSSQIQSTTAAVVSGNTYTVSIWIKRISGTGQVYIRAIENVNTPITITDEWVRYSVTATATSTVGRIGVNLATSGNSVAIWGAQLEASSYPTSYIPTTSSSATRVADACYKTGISSLIGQTEGTMFVQCNLQDSTGAGQAIATLYENSSNVVILYKQSDNVLKCFVVTGGTLVADLGSIAVSGNIKIAVGYKANDFALYINGVQRGTDTSGSVPTCSNLYLGADDGGAQKMSGIISQAILFKTRLTNAELASLTTI